MLRFDRRGDIEGCCSEFEQDAFASFVPTADSMKLVWLAATLHGMLLILEVEQDAFEVYVPTAVWQRRCLRVLRAARRQRLKLRFRDNKLATGLVCGRFGAVPSEQV